MNAMTYVLVPLAQTTIERLLDRRSEAGQPLDAIVSALLDQLEPMKVPHARNESGSSVNYAPRAARGERTRQYDGERGLIYQVLGTAYYANDANEALLAILRQLAASDAQFCLKLAQAVAGRTRNHLATTREAVYPNRPDLMKYVVALVPGWFLGTNIANREKLAILKHACDVAGLTPGKHLQIELPTAGPLS